MQFQEAINEYSELLRGCTGCAERARLLLGRSAAYAGFAERLRRIPASQVGTRAAPDAGAGQWGRPLHGP
jgi:hypothetical protein